MEKTKNKTQVLPTRMVLTEHAESEGNLLEPNHLQAGFSEAECCIIHSSGFILLDFGKELNGGIIITTQNVSGRGQNCRIVFGESVMEALSDIGYKNATNDHAVRDMTVELVPMSTMRFGNTGFRFVKIEAVGATITLKSICALTDIKDIEYKGSFQCNDELLNKIWETGAYTVHLNMHEYLWDGIKRDRLVWVGDMHPEVSTISAVFGYDDCVENSLDFVKEETPAECWMNHMPVYSMWWMIIQYDWYMQNGDFSYLCEQKEYMIALMNHAVEWMQGLNLLQDKIFVDWSSFDDLEVSQIGEYAVFCMAMEAGEKVFHLLGEKEMATKCRETRISIQNMNHQIPNHKQIAALCALAGLGDAVRINDEVLAVEPLQRLSTFLGYYVLIARAKAGDMEGALEVIRKYWGAMLEMGATTFWEDFDINWVENAGRIDEVVPTGQKDIHGDFGKHCYQQFRHSLCHGWASGPTTFLSQYVLGVHILEPGCKKVKIAPVLGDLNWVKGTYPTPFGIINIMHTKKENGKIETIVHAPEQVHVVMENK